MILDMEASSNHGLSSENEWQPTLLAHNSNAGQNSGGHQSGQSGHLIKLPFRVDVAHGSQEMNIMEWQAGANKTHHFVQRGDLIKVGNGGHIVQTSRSKYHSVYNIHLIHPYTHVSDTSVDCYPGSGWVGVAMTSEGPNQDSSGRNRIENIELKTSN